MHTSCGSGGGGGGGGGGRSGWKNTRYIGSTCAGLNMTYSTRQGPVNIIDGFRAGSGAGNAALVVIRTPRMSTSIMMAPQILPIHSQPNGLSGCRCLDVDDTRVRHPSSHDTCPRIGFTTREHRNYVTHKHMRPYLGGTIWRSDDGKYSPYRPAL